MIDLSNLSPSKGATKNRKRIGRGPGSGTGKTAGKGHKGRAARSGGNTPPGYEGGQMPLQRRLPKRGFRSQSHRTFAVVNLKQLMARFAGQSMVDPAALLAAGLVRKGVPVKILAEGELTQAFTVKAHAFSGAARQRIEAAGGQVEVITGA